MLLTEEAPVLGGTGGRVGAVEVELYVLHPYTFEDLLGIVSDLI